MESKYIPHNSRKSKDFISLTGTKATMQLPRRNLHKFLEIESSCDWQQSLKLENPDSLHIDKESQADLKKKAGSCLNVETRNHLKATQTLAQQDLWSTPIIGHVWQADLQAKMQGL